MLVKGATGAMLIKMNYMFSIFGKSMDAVLVACYLTS